MIKLWRKHPCHPHHDVAYNGGPVRLEGANKEILETGQNGVDVTLPGTPGLYALEPRSSSAALPDEAVHFAVRADREESR